MRCEPDPLLAAPTWPFLLFYPASRITGAPMPSRRPSVVLLRAEGRSFCAGYDIGAKPESADDWRNNPIKAHQHLAGQLDFEMVPWNLKKPVIASVQGHVMGGGCELVMLCDLTIAADNASFGEPEIRFSSVGPAIVMPAIIGYKKGARAVVFRRRDRR